MVQTSVPNRVNSIDVLRGLVMVIMALDHVRDFFSGFHFQPTDLEHTTGALFFTRWITHFCAPVFIFLSGTSAFLSMGKGRTTRQESYRLLTRGLWLVFLEVTFVRLGWSFDLNYHMVFLQVIWAIGISMVVLSALVFLPRSAILALGLLMIFGHNALDSLHPAGGWGMLWQLLHVQGPLHYAPGDTLFVMYPVIPWIGVMAVGFCFGGVFRLPARQLRNFQLSIGAGAIILFVVLRWTNIYGDPEPWRTQPAGWKTVLSFLNCTKYPPSLLYLLMTLGPAILLMPLLEQGNRFTQGFLRVYGRVPLFYYLAHIYLIHTLSLLAGTLDKGSMIREGIFPHPGYALPVVYGVWAAVVLLLYLPCRWFMGIKMSHRAWWLSYL